MAFRFLKPKRKQCSRNPVGIKPLNFPRRHPVNTHGFVDLKTKLDLMQKFSLGHCFWLGFSPNRHLQCIVVITLPGILPEARNNVLTDMSPLICVLADLLG